MKLEYAPGATPLDPDEITGLKPKHFENQAQLNEWENANIARGRVWAFSKKHKSILTIAFLCKLHKKMFDNTWRWAGTFRTTAKTIGVEASLISTYLKNLLDDVTYQVEHQTYSIDEIAYRFHHRLVAIHPFPNGNGRHARLMTDTLLIQLGEPEFNWGNVHDALQSKNSVRARYIASLKAADKHDYTFLSAFVRS
jgi:Fic-DOC domain mobile mystery protein B